ncbi:helix-turn-helix domain-containing protein [Salinispora arenicola]|uniref:helix-turn-helix domain-containing protein n=1 Tax=Salinispora arenicola TaxID=168697 RepID=UPI00207999EE|nr:helix-turn-helix transcriptional regulator [Salinispora arenicola]MCN0152712.1 helix-turn-helix domain-containing protein [Salinispora arenicola]
MPVGRSYEVADQLGLLLRRLRNQAGLTQEQVAERSGVSVRTIRRLESARNIDHRLGTLNLLADALELGSEDRELLATMLARTSTPPTFAVHAASTETRPTASASGPPRAPSRQTSVLVPARAVLDAAETLARETKRRWQREEEQRRVHDPFPLPLCWQPAPAQLVDYAANVQRLPPGATPQLDLSGDMGSIAEVYRRIRSGRLVILGRAGSGKSIMLIRLVLDSLAAFTLPERVPMIFNLGSWDATAITLRDWLIGQLLRDHPHLARRAPGGPTLAAALVDADLILPILDGFDEIADGLRREALEAFNATSLPLVLTSRRDEYAEAVRGAGAPLNWAAGIELVDLTLDDLAAYLPRTARQAGRDDTVAVWDPVLKLLQATTCPASVNLTRVLSTPLMVVLARTMYSETPDRDPAELLDITRFPSAKSVEKHLLAGFVPTVYRPSVPDREAGGFRQRNWNPHHAERWLGYLAHQLVRRGQDRRDLAWWQIGDSLRRSTRIGTATLVSALCIAVSAWMTGLVAGQVNPEQILVEGAMMGLSAGLAFGAVYAAITAFGGTFQPTHVRLRLRRRHSVIARPPIQTFTVRFAVVLLGGFVMGVGSACATALVRARYWETPLASLEVIRATLINMLVFGLIFGLAAGLVFGLLAALEVPVDVSFVATPVSLLSANRATVSQQILILAPVLALTIAFGGRLVVDLLEGGVLGELRWDLPDAFLIGAAGGLGGALSYMFCFTAWGQWVILTRVWLPLTGRLPWNTVAFLEGAYERGVLRQTGAVYQFRHVRLQQHLSHSYCERRRRSRRTPVHSEG